MADSGKVWRPIKFMGSAMEIALLLLLQRQTVVKLGWISLEMSAAYCFEIDILGIEFLPSA